MPIHKQEFRYCRSVILVVIFVFITSQVAFAGLVPEEDPASPSSPVISADEAADTEAGRTTVAQPETTAEFLMESTLEETSEKHTGSRPSINDSYEGMQIVSFSSNHVETIAGSLHIDTDRLELERNGNLIAAIHTSRNDIFAGLEVYKHDGYVRFENENVRITFGQDSVGFIEIKKDIPGLTLDVNGTAFDNMEMIAGAFVRASETQGYYFSPVRSREEMNELPRTVDGVAGAYRYDDTAIEKAGLKDWTESGSRDSSGWHVTYEALQGNKFMFGLTHPRPVNQEKYTNLYVQSVSIRTALVGDEQPTKPEDYVKHFQALIDRGRQLGYTEYVAIMLEGGNYSGANYETTRLLNPDVVREVIRQAHEMNVKIIPYRYAWTSQLTVDEILDNMRYYVEEIGFDGIYLDGAVLGDVAGTYELAVETRNLVGEDGIFVFHDSKGPFYSEIDPLRAAFNNQADVVYSHEGVIDLSQRNLALTFLSGAVYDVLPETLRKDENAQMLSQGQQYSRVMQFGGRIQHNSVKDRTGEEVVRHTMDIQLLSSLWNQLLERIDRPEEKQVETAALYYFSTHYTGPFSVLSAAELSDGKWRMVLRADTDNPGGALILEVVRAGIYGWRVSAETKIDEKNRVLSVKTFDRTGYLKNLRLQEYRPDSGLAKIVDIVYNRFAIKTQQVTRTYGPGGLQTLYQRITYYENGITASGVETLTYLADGTTKDSLRKISYDRQGRYYHIESLVYLTTGQIQSRADYYYDEQLNITAVHQSTYNAEGIIKTQRKNEYYPGPGMHLYRITDTAYTNEGIVSTRTVLTYDAAGLKQQFNRTSYYEDGVTVKGKISVEYQPDGIRQKSTRIYDYDADGAYTHLRVMSYQPGTNRIAAIYDFFFDASGKLLRNVTYIYNTAGVLLRLRTQAYYPGGTVIREEQNTWYDSTGSFLRRDVTRYDEEGHPAEP